MAYRDKYCLCIESLWYEDMARTFYGRRWHRVCGKYIQGYIPPDIIRRHPIAALILPLEKFREIYGGPLRKGE